MTKSIMISSGDEQVGVVRTDCSDGEIKEGDHESESVIEIFPQFQEALHGLDGFSNIFVFAFLHRVRPDQIGLLKVRPRRLLRRGFDLEGIPEVGVFAIVSPTRPNHYGSNNGCGCSHSKKRNTPPNKCA
jgi:tRNA (Thr-GGU) A37 N-methylase